MVSLLFGWVAAAQGGECAAATTVADLQANLTRAEAAYTDVDLDGFERAVEAARQVVPCLGEVVPPSTAAALHRIEGLSAFVANDVHRAELAFAAARQTDGAYRFPRELVPEDNPVQEAYFAVDPSKQATQELLPPPSGSVRIDGRPTRVRSPGLPSLFQWVEADGAPERSLYLQPGDPVPPWPSAIPLAAPDHRARKFVWGAVLGGVATAGLFGATAAVHGVYENPDTAGNQLDGLRAVNNGLLLGASGAGVFTLGAATTAVVLSL